MCQLKFSRLILQTELDLIVRTSPSLSSYRSAGSLVRLLPFGGPILIVLIFIRINFLKILSRFLIFFSCCITLAILLFVYLHFLLTQVLRLRYIYVSIIHIYWLN